jgi:hypothetical protein
MIPTKVAKTDSILIRSKLDFKGYNHYFKKL